MEPVEALKRGMRPFPGWWTPFPIFPVSAATRPCTPGSMPSCSEGAGACKCGRRSALWTTSTGKPSSSSITKNSVAAGPHPPSWHLQPGGKNWDHRTSLTTTWKRAWLSWSVPGTAARPRGVRGLAQQSAAAAQIASQLTGTVKPQDCPTSARCVTIWMAIAYEFALAGVGGTAKIERVDGMKLALCPLSWDL